MVYHPGRNTIPTPRVVNLTNFSVILTQFFNVFTNFSYFPSTMSEFHVKSIMCMPFESVVSVVVLLLKIHKNRTPDQSPKATSGKNHFPSGNNFIPTQAIGQESYSYEF